MVIIEIDAPAVVAGHGLLEQLAAPLLGQASEALRPQLASFLVRCRDERDFRSIISPEDTQKRFAAPEVGQQLAQGCHVLGVAGAQPLGQLVERFVAERLA